MLEALSTHPALEALRVDDLVDLVAGHTRLDHVPGDVQNLPAWTAPPTHSVAGKTGLRGRGRFSERL